MAREMAKERGDASVPSSPSAAEGRMDDSRLRRAFLEESEELSQHLSDSLLALEADRTNTGLLNEVFRLTHSLKSESALMGFADLSTIAHRMEDLLGRARDGTMSLDRRSMDVAFAGCDRITDMIGAIARGGSDREIASQDVLGHLSDLLGSASPTPVARKSPPPAGSSPFLGLEEAARIQLAEARDRGETLYRLAVHVARDEPMKLARAYLVFANLEQTCNVLWSSPSFGGEPVDDERYGSTEFYVTSAQPEADLRAAAAVDQVTDVELTRVDFDSALHSSETWTEAGGGGVEPRPRGGVEPRPRGGVEPRPGGGVEPRPGDSAPSASPAPGGTALPDEASAGRAVAVGGAAPGSAAMERTSIRVETHKLDDLWSLIGELVLHKSRIGELSDELGRGGSVQQVREELSESFDSLDKISSGMQQAMMDTRMIPISIIYSKFPRLVRDLSRKLGKPVELSLAGEETQIDRTIVEALSDPLTHIIRNAIDHGLEFPEERVRMGKPEKGRVSVSARRQGGNIVIELVDDGRGIDIHRIRQKAIAQGMEGAEGFSEAQLLELIFLPGFSTKEVVTDISGRGVGLDVVATRIRGDLKGDVLLRSEQGRGTRVTLVLPLTLTIVNALVVRGGSYLYAIPLSDVDTTARILPVDIARENGRDRCMWNDEALAVYSLTAMFGGRRTRAEEYFAAVLRNGDRRAYLIVDELIQEREIVIKPVDDLLNRHRLFSGLSVLEDGRLIFILDTSFIQRESLPQEVS